jgi:hypothetical protein
VFEESAKNGLAIRPIRPSVKNVLMPEFVNHLARHDRHFWERHVQSEKLPILTLSKVQLFVGIAFPLLGISEFHPNHAQVQQVIKA